MEGVSARLLSDPSGLKALRSPRTASDLFCLLTMHGFVFFNIYLSDSLGLSCSTRDLRLLYGTQYL